MLSPKFFVTSSFINLPGANISLEQALKRCLEFTHIWNGERKTVLAFNSFILLNSCFKARPLKLYLHPKKFSDAKKF